MCDNLELPSYQMKNTRENVTFEVTITQLQTEEVTGIDIYIYRLDLCRLVFMCIIPMSL